MYHLTPRARRLARRAVGTASAAAIAAVVVASTAYLLGALVVDMLRGEGR